MAKLFKCDRPVCKTLCWGEKKIREVSVGCLKKRRGGGSKLELFNFGDTKCTMM